MSENTSVNNSELDPHEDSSVTMLDVLEQEKKLEEEYAAVLGASDEKACTYAKGAIPRQALYSCLTCCPEARNDITKSAGICLACSYRCHEQHELIELYTKRNFRCDCPTVRLGKNCCALNSQFDVPQPANSNNLYNQNFKGIYCKCKRPYPDPEATTEEVMIQCTMCEDWYHLAHLIAPPGVAKILDAYSEMICDMCMEKHTFLNDYRGLALKPVENAKENVSNVTVDVTEFAANEDNKLKSDLDKSIADIMNINAPPAETALKTSAGDAGAVTTATDEALVQAKNNTSEDMEPKPAKIRRLSQTEHNATDCQRPKSSINNERGATFWGNDWRAALCKCTQCMELYKKEKVEYLIDPNDSSKAYEERGMRRAAEESTSYEQGIRALATIGHTQQIDALTEYNHMKTKLMEYLQTFAANKQVVTEADITRFFERMRNERNANLGQPYFCR